MGGPGTCLGSGVPVLRGWEVRKGLALSTGSAVVFLALEILLSFSSSCWGRAQQLALSPACLLTAARGSLRGPAVAEERSSDPGGSHLHSPRKSPSHVEVIWVSLPPVTPWGGLRSSRAPV